MLAAQLARRRSYVPGDLNYGETAAQQTEPLPRRHDRNHVVGGKEFIAGLLLAGPLWWG